MSDPPSVHNFSVFSDFFAMLSGVHKQKELDIFGKILFFPSLGEKDPK